MRQPPTGYPPPATEDGSGNIRSLDNLYMNGSEIFTFTLRTVPRSVNQLLAAASRDKNEVDLYVFHQANKFMLDHLRQKLAIPEDKFCISLEQYGNTVSSTIPIALRDAVDAGKLHPGMLVMVVGFGVGYSWGGALIRWV